MEKFIIKKQANEKLVFELLAGNDQVIITSEEYETRVDSENGILSVQTNSHLHSRYKQMESPEGEHFFILRSSNDKVIAISGLFHTKIELSVRIQIVMEIGRSEEVEDLALH
ncbi:YegP family protein [Dyadobacter aurulentus]|uniref:YegP family protein n=1 Tax=Dyadobacter sp. UC 10 TaxID=2605428 RepID=UPI0011F24751|nr:DUF1508 domain-containing protein [Dyadobacter sp. UC 10]KAA0992068.1 DUF1508 domain-containing protein [Dyadobacter sp. UC 10]